MGDLISRSALIEWINKQREQVTKKQVAGTDGSIFTRETLVTMQRCISTFETKINNMPTAYDVDNVVEQIKNKKCKKCRNILSAAGAEEYCKDMKCEIEEICEIVRKGGVDEQN